MANPDPRPPCYRVVTDGTQGRHCIATRLIRAGSVIVAEEPLVIAPSAPSTAGCVTCLGCCAVISSSCMSLCAGCSGPLCSSACEKSPFHVDECNAMGRTGFRFKSAANLSSTEYSLLGFLRVLLLRGDNATRCRQLKAHQEKVLGDPKLRMILDALAPQLMPALASYTLEQRCWAYGVMETNSFSYEERQAEREALVLMGDVSMFGHSCVCNAFGNCYDRPEGATGFAALLGLRKVLVAATDIEPGQAITVSYEHPHLPTHLRRGQLLRTKYFTCHCRRCEDPTELGLHTGALCCEICMGRNIMRLPVPRSPGEAPTSWRCVECKTPMTTSAGNFEWELAKLESEIVNARERGAVEFLEDFLRKRMYPRGRLHPTHELVLDAKYALVTKMYGQLKGFQMQDLSGSQLNVVSSHCQDYLKAIAIAQPGYGLRMARVNLVLNRVLLEIVKRTAKLPPSDPVLEKMNRAEECLHECKVALRFSSDMKLELSRAQEVTEHVRTMLGWLAIASQTLQQV